jgi:hypothetical protein
MFVISTNNEIFFLSANWIIVHVLWRSLASDCAQRHYKHTTAAGAYVWWTLPYVCAFELLKHGSFPPLFKKDSFNLLTCFNNTKRTPSFTANYLQPGAVPRGVQPVPPTFVFSGPNTLATIRKRKRSGFYQHFVFLPSLAFCLLVSWYSHSSSIAKDGTLLQSATCMVHATLARG